MSYDGQIVRIEKLTNGYEVEICDPAVKSSNKNSKVPYKDPWKSYAFTKPTEVIAFLTKTLSKLTPAEDDYGTNFDRAVSTSMED